jgi:non-heme chloroperoxidase
VALAWLIAQRPFIVPIPGYLAVSLDLPAVGRVVSASPEKLGARTESMWITNSRSSDGSTPEPARLAAAAMIADVTSAGALYRLSRQLFTARTQLMSTVTVGQENTSSIDLYYEDHGSGKPVILIHGYPLSGASWEKQTSALLAAGMRVITYDRRGFGKSSQPTTGYDYDTFADDLRHLITKLDLKEFSLAGFSMGGGEVARYIGKHGSAGVRKAVIIAGVPPYLLKTSDNAEGVDKSVFDGIEKAATADRYAYFTDFFTNFYNTDELLGKRISQQALENSWDVAIGSSATATVACVRTWYTDFRNDMPKIDVPTLVLHGSADRILPPATSGDRSAKLIKGARYVVIDGAPHGMLWTHADEVNAELVRFLA